jgi:vitamin B12 transporter
MKNLKNLVAISLLLTMVGFAQNDGSVSGLVMIDDNPIANAEIILTSAKGERRETVSDAKGKYVFENVAAGEYTLTASQYPTKSQPPNTISVNGNLTISQKIVVLQGQSLTTDLNFSLLRTGKKRVERSRTIAFDSSTDTPTISIGTGTSQPTVEASKSINLVYSTQIKERNETTLVDTLRTEYGFFVQQNGGFGRPSTIRIRGLRSSDTSILIDGMRFRDAAAIDGDSSAFVGDFAFTSVPQIEVLRGSGSSVWGSNAIGGVINLQTQGRGYGFHGGLTAEIGSLGRKRIRANINDGWNKFGYSIGVSRTNVSEGIDGDDDASNTGFNGRFDFRLKSQTQIFARFFVSDAFVKLNSNPFVINPQPFGIGTPVVNAVRGVNFQIDQNDPDLNRKSSIYNGQIRLIQKLGEKLWFTSAYQELRTSRNNADGAITSGLSTLPGFQNKFSGEIRTFENKLNWTTKRNSLTVGYEYEWENIVSAVAQQDLWTISLWVEAKLFSHFTSPIL